MYITLAVALIAIAAYYPIKLIKFYSMESAEQGLKARITQDLREGKVSRNLILLVLGEGGLRLTRNQLDVVFEWMVQNTNAWNVRSDKGLIVMFRESPFRPDCWSSLGDYKHVMRQMFGEFGTKDFLNRRCSAAESGIIKLEIRLLEKKESNVVNKFDYVIFDHEGVEVLGMVMDISAYDSACIVRILSGSKKGMFFVSNLSELISVSHESALRELIRQKEEWKGNKLYSNE